MMIDHRIFSYHTAVDRATNDLQKRFIINGLAMVIDF